MNAARTDRRGSEQAARHWAPASALLAMGLLFSSTACALDVNLGSPFGEELSGTLNTGISGGVGIRMQGASRHLIGKQNLDPNVCAPPYAGCQGLFRTQTFPAEHLANAPGGSQNGDDGDLNYRKKYDLFQAPFKVTSDLTLGYAGYTLFARALYFYDAVNNDFDEYHPNRITPDNVDQVGRVGSTLPVGALSSLPPVLTTASTGRFYGPGGVVRNRRRDHEVLDQAGTSFQLLDVNIAGTLPLWDERELKFKVGRQLVNWGESTTLVLNSLNISPVDANNAFRIGGQVEEFFTPVNQIDLSTTVVGSLSAEIYYQLEWQPIEAPTPGTYFSDIDAGTNNTVDNIGAGFGLTEDPKCVGKLLDSPLSAATATCGTAFRLRDWEPPASGQYGIKLDYYAEELWDGTGIAVSYQNYHSRLPYVSLFSAYPSCARKEGNALGIDATDLASTLSACPDLPLAHVGDPRQATSSALQIETARFVLEYPEDIHLFGLSGNVTAFGYSFQGEVAYRPNKPMQIDVLDLSFAALGNQGWACGLPGVNCIGTAATPGLGWGPDGGTMTYGGSDAVNASGVPYVNDTIGLGVGHVTGAQRNFPNFVIPYRGGEVGRNAPCYPEPGSADDVKYGLSGFTHPYYKYDRHSPCYIRGYERFDDFQFNLGATKIYSTSENWILADQVILVYELGAEYVPGLPAYDQLVLQAPGVTWGPTAGADGSGADGSRSGCSTIPNCSYGPDGLRFNPHQQDHGAYPDKLSWGYRIIVLPTYEQIVPKITLKPTLLISHDVNGTSPGPAGNFVSGRILTNLVLDFRYLQALNVGIGYGMSTGGGRYNTLRDRDFAQFYVRYQF